MVRRLIVSTLLILVTKLTFSQELKLLTSFDALVGHSWEITGKWANGLDFKQEIFVDSKASGTIITTDTKSYITEDQTEWGPRNHGIRQIDHETGTLMFYEFDAFGRMTKGEVQVKENDFYYVYEYEGMTLCDKWEYVSPNHYKYIIGTLKEGEIETIYLEGKISRLD